MESTGIWLNNVDDICFGVLLCVSTIILFDFLREVLGSITTINDRNRKFLNEAISTAELTVICIENCFIVQGYYPYWLYMFFGFCYSVWCNHAAHRRPANQRATASPIDTIVAYLKSEIDFEMLMITMIVQTISACLVYFIIIKPAWTYAWVICFWKNENIHTFKISEKVWPASEWTLNNLSEAAVTEGSVVAILYLSSVCRRIYEVDENNIGRYLLIAFETCVNGLGVHISGGYWNPALATSMELTTVGMSWGLKIWLYWFCASFGVIVGLFLENAMLKS